MADARALSLVPQVQQRTNEPPMDDRADRLRRRWREASADAGWSWPDDWQCAEVEAVTEQLVHPTGQFLPACARLGRARAASGVWLDETLEDVAALLAVTREVVPVSPGTVIRAVAEAWADEGAAQFRTISVEDPTTGLATLAYLRTRLAEVYREADRSGERASASHALVVVNTGVRQQPQRGRLLRGMALGECLRSVFSGGETLAAAGTERALGLVARTSLLPTMVQMVQRELSRLDVPGATPRAWIERLPEALPAAIDLVADLSR
ncbi:hypothetical protein [Fodinicola acaciae]|uniref:hypothetical protein n=1 Tax=Fodinicola acaciae TaxID=2681555 RepID=UPI0013D309E7|nr:hypothetical protein [Fodinicola acaciae]